jgi:adenylate kinase
MTKAKPKTAPKKAVKTAAKKPVKKTQAKKLSKKPVAKKSSEGKSITKAALKKSVIKSGKKSVLKNKAKKAVVKNAAKKAVVKNAAKKAIVKNAAKKAVVKNAAKKAVVKKAVKKAVVKKAVKKAVVKKAVKKAIVRKALKEAIVKKVLAKAVVKKALNKADASKELKRVGLEIAIANAIERQNIAAKKALDVPSKKLPKKLPRNKKVKYTLNELKHFRKIILEEQRSILESARANMAALVDNESGEYKGDNLTYASHMAEQGTDEMEREKNYMFVQRDEKYLGYLQDALMRIDQGTYGICVDCKDESKNLCKTCPLIPKERLEVVPITTHCIECKNLRSS